MGLWPRAPIPSPAGAPWRRAMCSQEIIVCAIRPCFPGVFDNRGPSGMARTVWLICRRTGEATLMGREDVARVVKVEPSYIAEIVASDGMFLNAFWLVVSHG